MSRIGKHIGTKSRLMISRAWGKRKMGLDYSLSIVSPGMTKSSQDG
jgi:hypothetical protein